MIKKFLITALILTTPKCFAYDYTYVSPESYAVNEADFTDYKYIPASPKLNLDTLETLEKPAVEVTIEKQSVDKTEKRIKKSKQEDPEAYKKKISYKVAKWWVDKRYEREEEHHGTKHEIKVKAREEYERRMEETNKSKSSNNIY